MASPASDLPSSFPRRRAGYQPAQAWFAGLAFIWIFVIIYKGAFTTSIGAGMVFPDWPLSNGSLNPEGWLSDRDMLAEHGHRLAAGVMAGLSIVLATWLHRHEARPWVRRLGWAVVALVFAQALVGGLRVLLDHLHVAAVNNSVGRLFAMVHACLAQLFLCLVAAVAIGCSRPWIERRAGLRGPAPAGLRRAALAALALLFVQLVVAAVMRHSHAGMATPTFPHNAPDHGWLPTIWSFPVAIHFTHRVLALGLALVLPALAWKLWRSSIAPSALRLAAGGLVLGVALQIFLGAATVLSGRSPYYATWHVIVGALLMVLVFSVAWVLHRDQIDSAA